MIFWKTIEIFLLRIMKYYLDKNILMIEVIENFCKIMIFIERNRKIFKVFKLK
jgi:hypothetical protein